MVWIKGLLFILICISASGIEAKGRKRAQLTLKGTVPKVARIDPVSYQVKANHPVKIKQTRSPASTTQTLTVISE